MEFSLLSKYRGQLMGVAILLVALFHSSMDHAYLCIDILCFGGDMGVDIFFLVSGFGMYYTFLKKPKLSQFYLKRIVRIVPAWFLVNLYIRFQGHSWPEIDKVFLIKTMTGFSFWIDGNLYFWYVPAMLAFYLITPCFMCLYRKKKSFAYLTFGMVWLILLSGTFIAHNADYYIFLFRWPIYFIGVYLGECSYYKKKIEKKHAFVSVGMLIAGLVAVDFVRRFNYLDIVRYDYKYFLYLFVAVPICIWLSILFEKVSYDFVVLKFLGSITLEIYLLHEYILRKITTQLAYIPFDKIGIVYNFLVFLFTVGMAYLLHWMIEIVIRICKKKKK